MEVKGIGNPHEEGKQGATWIGSGYTKLYIWSLVQFKRVFYIDADCMVMSSLDDVFSRKCDFAAAPDVFPPDHFNAGVLFIKPDLSIFKDMLSRIIDIKPYDGGDTGFLNSYFPDWYSMPS